jgi:hypothetical protein
VNEDFDGHDGHLDQARSCPLGRMRVYDLVNTSRGMGERIDANNESSAVPPD